jgi:hypothetical protein
VDVGIETIDSIAGWLWMIPADGLAPCPAVLRIAIGSTSF